MLTMKKKVKKVGILVSSCSLPSAKLLRDAIEEITNLHLFVTTNPDKLDSVLIRYGNSYGEFKECIYNTPEFIRLLSDKNCFSKVLLQNGFYCPEFSRDKTKISEFPVMLRSSLTWSKGRGINVVKTKEDVDIFWTNSHHWTKYIPMQYEIRCHILGGGLAKVFKKVWRKEEPEAEFPIRINDTYDFVLQNIGGKYNRLYEVVGELTKLLGENNFYSLDIGWDNSKKDYFILEGNSAPGLNSLTANMYAEFLVNRLEM
jgi:hypothetical protein